MPLRASTNKYGNVATLYAGRKYRSKLEASCALQLDVLKRAGEIRDWQYEPERIPIHVNGQLICTWLPDFVVALPDGRREIWECKGVETKAFALKLKLFRSVYPDMPVKIIRASDFSSDGSRRGRKR
jgi:hypothetical protein